MVHRQNRVGARIAVLSVVLFTLALGMSSLSAQGVVSSIAQGFQTNDANVKTGAVVSLKAGSPNTVELSTIKNLPEVIGVVGSSSLIELSDGVTSVKIVTSGTTPTLVSDINGTIRTGDRITTSPIAGVGMKATTSGLVIATAQSNFSNAASEMRTVKDKSGKDQAVRIGAVRAQIDKVYYEAPGDQNSFLPPAWQDFANNVAGHQVSPIRVMLASLLGVVLFGVIAVLLYSAVRSSIISIGRNPLSEPAVHKSLLQVGISILGVLVFAAIVIYLILTT